MSVAQLIHGDRAAKTSGTGIDQRKPITASTINGTQIQWRSLFVGLAWLSPYSSSQSATGALQAAQSGNQLVALQTKQLAELTAVTAAIARAQSLEGARNVESEEQAQQQLSRFLDYGSGYQPGSARMFY